MSQINTNRKYSIVTVCNGEVEWFDLYFEEFINSDTNSETIYSLREEADAVLDLGVNSSMYFQPNRDNTNSKGIVTRIA